MRAAWPGADQLERRGGSGDAEEPAGPGLERLRDLGAPASRAGLLSWVPRWLVRLGPGRLLALPLHQARGAVSRALTSRYGFCRLGRPFLGQSPRGCAEVRPAALVSGAGDRVIEIACGPQGREAGQVLEGLLRLPFVVSARVIFK